MSQSTILRLSREIAEVQKSHDLSIAVAAKDQDIRNVRALIVGPPDTPYEFGFFEFSLKFGRDYPAKAPAVTALTTNSGRTRFNPNIYAAGKVCLSILGTWRGERGEEWSSAQGLESILISIQSLMSANPYENEPGFENAASQNDKDNMMAYKRKIRHETLRVSIIQRLEEYLSLNSDCTRISQWNSEADADGDAAGSEDSAPFEPFKDVIKRRFFWYYHAYLASVAKEVESVIEQQQFAKMPFEHPGNSMDGIFSYTNLEKRMKYIRQILDEETEQWVADGRGAVQKELGIAVNLRRQFEQTLEHFRKSDIVTLDIELVDDNPFVWELTYFGRPMTNLDGGLFKIRINFSTEFPEEQPRVRFVTPMYHHKITVDGIPCYFPKKPEEARAHVEAIIYLLEEENPPYDPRTEVNVEAAKLFWGSKEDKREYNRRLRRAVQRSVDVI